MNFRLRRAVREDLPRLVDLELGLGIHNKESLEIFFRKVFNPNLRSSKVFVAEVDGEVVGSLCYDIRESKGETFISGLYIHQDFRRNGIGSKLLSLVEKEARLRGMKKVGLVAMKDASNFYEKMGFRKAMDYGKWGMVKDILH